MKRFRFAEVNYFLFNTISQDNYLIIAFNTNLNLIIIDYRALSFATFSKLGFILITYKCLTRVAISSISSRLLVSGIWQLNIQSNMIMVL